MLCQTNLARRRPGLAGRAAVLSIPYAFRHFARCVGPDGPRTSLTFFGGVAMPQTHVPSMSTAEPGEDVSALECPTFPRTGTWQCGSCEHHYPTGVSCRRCVSCEGCNDAVRVSLIQTTARGSAICDDCLDRFYWQCRQCDGWNRDDEDCGTGCCDPDNCGCVDCRADSYLVHSWDYQPRPVFHGDGRLFLGSEIEIETPYSRQTECAKLAARHLGRLGYLKQDGSLECGFEIVTHPMSYEWALANFPWQMLADLARAGCDTSEATGIHVHLSRAGFHTPCHTYRWMKFIYRNETQVTQLARRSSPRWAAFTPDDRQLAKQYAKGARSEDRYRAINTGNHATFELRVFASSLDPRQVKAVLGFAAASVEYTRSLTARDIVSERGWEWPSFVAWLQQRPVYQPLVEQLEVLSCVC